MNRRMTGLCLLIGGLASSSHAAVINGYAAMGASETQGTTYLGSWVPYLAIDRGLNFGPSQSYNRAIGGSTTTTLLSQGQHTQVANLVANGSVDVAYLFIGGLDVPPIVPQLVLGTLDVPTWANGVASRMMTAVDTVLAQGPEGMIISGIPDMTLVPGAAPYASVPEVRLPVINAINYVNDLIKSEVLARDLVYVDIASAMRDFNATPLIVGGVTINVTTGSTNPRNFFQDDIHPGTVGNGFFANLMLTALNIGFDKNYALISDQAILAKTSISNLYTGETSNVDFAKYVYTTSTVPEASSVLLLSAVTLVGSVGIALRRRGRSAA